jgi:hypothetical protein
VVQKLPLLEGLGISHALLKALPTEVKVSCNYLFSGLQLHTLEGTLEQSLVML